MSQGIKTSQTDEELMQAYCLGDYASFDVLFKRHQGRVFSYISRRVTDQAVAEDLFQKVFSRLHEKRGQYDGSLPLLPWIFTIIKNILVDHFRKEGRQNSHLSLDVDVEALPDGNAQDSSSEEFLNQITRFQKEGLLSEVQASALSLRFQEGLNFNEIAERLSMDPANARQIVGRTLKKLRKFLDKKGLL